MCSVDIITRDVDRVHWMLTPRPTSCSVLGRHHGRDVDWGSLGPRAKQLGGSSGCVVYPVNIMAVMSTWYIEFLTYLRDSSLSYFLQTYVYPVD